MKKTLNTNTIQNELSGNSLYFKKQNEERSDKEVEKKKGNPPTIKQPTSQSVNQSTDTPAEQLVAQPNDQKVEQETALSADIPATTLSK